jgi:hypothetical protein
MKKVFVVISILATLCGLSFAQTSFDSELSGLRKSIISMCAQLQAGQLKESQEQLLKEIDEIIAGWEKITDTYKNTPPVEYSKDPDWKNYLDEALDNFQIMRQKVEGKDYKRAVQFCGLNCALFVKIHQVNGRTTLADKMFGLRQNVRMAVSMAKAENWQGAQNLIKRTETELKEITKLSPQVNVDKKTYSEDIVKLQNIFNEIKIVTETKKKELIDSQLKTFIKDFGNIYLKYI